MICGYCPSLNKIDSAILEILQNEIFNLDLFTVIQVQGQPMVFNDILHSATKHGKQYCYVIFKRIIADSILAKDLV